MKRLSIIAGSVILLLALILGIYFTAQALTGGDRMWCASGRTRALGCYSDIGMAATIIIFFIALIIGLIIRVATNRKAVKKIQRDSSS